MREVIILLNGNHCSGTITQGQEREFMEEFKQAVNGHNDWIELLGNTLRRKSVIGYYIRAKTISPQARIVELLEKEANKGDEWKAD